MAYINKLQRSVFLLSLVFLVSEAFAAPKMVSSKPLYFNIVDIKGSGKTVAVIFDESKGTKKGYDTAYIDANCNSVFETSEKHTVKTGKTNDISFINFPPVELSKFLKKNQKSLDLVLAYYSFENENNFPADLELRYINGDRYYIANEIKPSPIKSKPYIWKFISTPSLKTDVKPGKKSAEIALTLLAGNSEVYSDKINAEIVITNKSGKVIKKDKGNIDKFGFG